MIFNSLTLKNFRQFGGTQTIEFSTDRNKNVTFVLERKMSCMNLREKIRRREKF